MIRPEGDAHWIFYVLLSVAHSNDTTMPTAGLFCFGDHPDLTHVEIDAINGMGTMGAPQEW